MPHAVRLESRQVAGPALYDGGWRPQQRFKRPSGDMFA